jgi:hypothetical protein
MKNEKFTSLDQLLIALMIAGPCQGGFFCEEDRSTMELRHNVLMPITCYLSDIVETSPKQEVYKSDNIKVTIRQDTILGSDLKLIAQIEIFDTVGDIIMNNLNDLKMANAIVQIIGVLSNETELSFSTMCNAQTVTWHFPFINL